VQNPSFEEGGGSFDDWIVHQDPLDLSVAVVLGGALDNIAFPTSILHAAHFSIGLLTTNGAGWISQRMVVCPNTVYIPDFNFLWGAALPSDVAAQCSLQLGWGNYPGDLSNVTSVAFGTLTGGVPLLAFSHLSHDTPVISLHATAANQTSAYLQIGMSCIPSLALAVALPFMAVDSIQLYPSP
jgi:hypothetical protein